MKNPEELKKEGLEKFCTTYRKGLEESIRQLEEKINNGDIEYFLTGQIFIGTELPMPQIMESATLSQRLAIKKKTEQLMAARLGEYNWKIIEVPISHSGTVQYFLVKKS